MNIEREEIINLLKLIKSMEQKINAHQQVLELMNQKINNVKLMIELLNK